MDLKLGLAWTRKTTFSMVGQGVEPVIALGYGDMEEWMSLLRHLRTVLVGTPFPVSCPSPVPSMFMHKLLELVCLQSRRALQNILYLRVHLVFNCKLKCHPYGPLPLSANYKMKE